MSQVTMRQMLEAGVHLVTKPVTGTLKWLSTFLVRVTKSTS